MNCPVCSSPVLYEGLTSLECAGRSCQNYRGAAAESATIEFADTLIDWDWFVAVSEWLSHETGLTFIPDKATRGGDQFISRCPAQQRHAWGASPEDTRKDFRYRWLPHFTFFHLVKSLSAEGP